MRLYLKEIRMENFKSFGKKLTVPFLPGFTAITGPNGSGKSNIIDAILFVLGPKSSKVMRAGRLTDLIFNGGKKLKNPAKYCRVSLVFDNSDRKLPIDTDAVSLTRMIKRAPLKHDPDNYYSYYYINERGATYSEFIDLLSHARISGDGYNIVKQGDVTDIIKMGPVERRKIIEDVAGISSFDSELKKAESEKVQVEQNLERINIIINEINSQLRHLKKERDEAYRYTELKTEQDTIKAKMVTKKIRDIDIQINEVHTQITTYQQEQQQAQSHQEEQKRKYQRIQDELRQIEEKITESGGDDAADLKDTIDTLRTDLVKTQEKITYLKEENKDLKNDQNRNQTTLHGIQQELQELKETKQELEATIKDITSQHEQTEHSSNVIKEQLAQHDDSHHDLTLELTKMRETYHEQQNELHELNLKADRLKEQLGTLDLSIAEIKQKESSIQFEIKDTAWRIEELQTNHQTHQKSINKLEKSLFEKTKQESILTGQLSELSKHIFKLQREQTQLQAELDAVQSIQSKYNPAVSTILAARDNNELSGIRGTIAELAHVEEQYMGSLSIAAGSRMQSIVVTDDEAAAKAIRYLKQQRCGRATFLPLNKMITGKPRAKPLLAVNDEASHGFAFDIVDFDPEYAPAFWYVFGDTVVVETLNDARRLMGGVRLVDLQGNLIEASGAMVGGSKPHMNLSFGNIDRGKLDSISRDLESALIEQDHVSDQLNILKPEITEIQEQLRTLTVQSDVETQLQKLHLQKQDYEKQLQLISDELLTKRNEQATLREQREEIITTIQELEASLDALETKKEEKGKLLLSITKKETAQQLQILEQQLQNLHISLLEHQSELATLQKNKTLLQQRETEVTTTLEKIESELITNQNTINELQKKKQDFDIQFQTHIQVKQKITGKLKGLHDQRDNLYKQSVHMENELDKISTRIESLNDLINRAEYRLPTLDNTKKDLQQELQLYHIAIDSTEKLSSLDDLKKSLVLITETMEELEPVNMRALDEYEHQQQRKDFFISDINRLKQQKRDLEKLAHSVITKKTDRFMVAFNTINENFVEIYSTISEGGEAELILENPDDPFSGGLTIKARPRGKKILRLSALSGGEKSMASLGFIFALQNYDPSPFYVLDEVDMFLDGINAETLARVLRSNSTNSQFINVSLRKILLKQANHIYGVTMLDNGVSEMIGNLNADAVGPQGEILTRRN